MVEDTKANLKIQALAAAFLSAVFFAVWSYFYLPIYMNTDLGWLFLCLERFLDGGTYTGDFYETNPPLSFLVYLPAMLIYKLFDFTSAFSIYVGTLFYVILSGFFFFRLLRRSTLRPDLILALMVGFIFSQTWLMGPSFGLKDHLIFLWLAPLCVLQYLITCGKPPGKAIGIAVSFFGALSICLKPHYALIPALFFLHRLYKARSLRPILAGTDFWAMAATGGLYVLLILSLFPDYYHVILPETIALYTDEAPFHVYARLSYFSFAAAALISISLLLSRRDQLEEFKIAVYALCTLSALCFIPYAMQDKGYHYHSLPFLGFTFMALAVAVFAISIKYLKSPMLATLITYSILSASVFSFVAGSTERFLTHKEFATLPFHEKIKELAWNKTYAVLAFKSPDLSLPYYTDLSYGSRFGQLWPLMGLSLIIQTSSDKSEKEALRARMSHYIDLIADDIARYSPSVIAVPRYPGKEGKKSDHYFQFMMKNIRFAEKMKSYDFIESHTIDEHIFEKGAKRLSDKDTEVTYDLFVLKNETPQAGTGQ